MEPIAITGIGCRLPSGVTSPGDLWANLLTGADLISETPPDRWSTAAHYHPNRAVPGRTYSRWGGYVSDPTAFDAPFFGLTPREAMRMDPQQRWLLETAWEAIQDAGYPLAALAGSGTGVYVGVSSCDYGDIQKRGRYDADMHTSTGQALSIASNRVSYLFDLRGPSLSVDTACSSSLVALDLACRAIWRGDVPLALVGGVNAIFQADIAVAFSKAGMLSPTGRCRAFDASADGFVRSEGAGVVVLRPLSKALADGDRVYAAIRSTMTNQDGRTSGLTVPSGDQQQSMLEEAYRRAGVRPERVGYVEAHGTGTPVGDPIEAGAIGRALGVCRPADRPLWIGSVKSNLGHLEPASGVAGLIKLALALRHRTVPPNVHFRNPNPNVPFGEYRLRVPTAAVRWEPSGPDDTLYGGVNSFGFGGTNAHAVLSSAPAAEHRPKRTAVRRVVWTVSARSAPALEEAIRQDATFLEEVEPERYSDLAAAAGQRRTHHAYRVAVVGGTPAVVGEQLRRGAGGAGVFAGHVASAAPAVALVFSGQGTQWPGMARDLLGDPRFHATIDELDAALRQEWGRSLVAELERGDDAVFRSDVGQPILFALQVGVYRLLNAWGVRPVAVLGHSIGEVAAAFAAGALTLADTVRVIVQRSRTQETTRGTGAMAAVGVSEAEARSLVARLAGRLHVAAINGPTDTTLAGDADAVRSVVDELAAKGTFARLLPFPYAFHSPAMDPCRNDFLAAVADLSPRAGEVPFLSAVTGTELPGEALDVAYWWRNVREPVRFSAAVARAAELGASLFVEVGPHPGLLRYVVQTATATVVPTLKKNEDGLQCLGETVAALYVHGVPIDWAAFLGGLAPHADLPRHPWHRQLFWAEGEESRHHRLTAPTHPLLGLREPGPVRQWEACLSAEQFLYLADHGFRGRAVFPATGHLELLLAAAAEGSFAEPVALADVNFDRAVWADEPFVLRTAFDPVARRLTVSSRPAADADGGWEGCSRAVRRTPDGSSAREEYMPPEDAVEVSVAEMYDRFERAGHHYGPLFRTVRRLRLRGGELWAEIELDASLHAEAAGYYLHPALLDGALQSALRATPSDEERESMFLPVRLERVEWRRRAGTAVVCHVRNVVIQDVRWFADIDLFTPEGESVASLAGCCCVKKPQESHIVRGETKVYREEWIPAALTTGGAPPDEWLVIDPAGTAGELVERLTAGGGKVRHRIGADATTPPGFPDYSGGNTALVLWTADTRRGVTPYFAGVLGAVEPLLTVARELGEADAPAALWLVTVGATFGHGGVGPDLLAAPVAGMLRTVATEFPGVTCRLLDLDPDEPEWHAERAFAELRSSPPEDEIAYRGGGRLAARLAPVNPDALPWRLAPKAQSAGANYELRTTDPGSLDGLAWVETEPAPLAPHEVELEVRAVGLNFRDVLKALDAYPLAPTEPRLFGDECAGVVRRVGAAVAEFRPGDAVVAVAAHGFSNLVRVPSVLTAHKPANLSFEQAATIPIAFLTADYCLTDLARLEHGESVLINAAAGGVGQAAVQIARRAGAEVFATASPEKHDLLRARGVRHVFNSRDLSFAAGVRAATNGRGVDVALNSLAGEFIPRTLELLAPGGRFVEIGKKDIFQNAPLDLNPFRNAVSFAAVDLAAVIARKPEWVGRRLRALVDLFLRGELVPLPVTAFPADRVADAFRLMASGKHTGKLVVTPDPSAPPATLLAHERPIVRSNASYLVTGGLSGLGLRTAEWLASEGAKWLVLAGRGGARSDAARRAVEDFAARGVRVEVVACDVTDPAAVETLVRPSGGVRPPLRGVVHSAMVLHDEPLARVTRAALEEVLAPKVAGAWNLHAATRDLPLDWFVMYSSVAALVGSAGQASYVAANRFLDALAWHRRYEGLPATSLNWGPLAEVGVAADSVALGCYLESVGLALLPPDEVFRFLKFLLRRDVTTAGVARIDWEQFRASNPAARQSRRLAAAAEQKADSSAGSGADPLGDLLALPDDGRARPAFLVTHLQRSLAAVLRAEESSLDPSAPLASFGVDSLMAFEFKLRVDRDFRTNIPVARLSAGATLAELSALLLGQLCATLNESGAADAPPAPAEPRTVPTPAPSHGDYLRVLTRESANGQLDGLTFDAAALLYVPDRVSTVGGVADKELPELFGPDPFVSHLYETEFGRIGVITLPIRGRELFGSPRLASLVRRAGELAHRKGARCLSLTGLVPSATDYGRVVRDWLGDSGPRVTTGHATTTAAVILNLRSMLDRVGRYLGWEHLAVLGLGSIGRSCLALALDSLPHPQTLTLCDVFAKRGEADALTRALRERHGYRGRVRVLTSGRGLPDGLYEATTILTAVSVPGVIDVARLRPGTILADDSYPPAFSLERAIERTESDADLFFGNAGMARLPELVRETVFLPPGAGPFVARFGDAAFRRELARDPHELTACILSALLTDRHQGFGATVGLAELADLRGHARGLVRLGITAARPQCGTYFLPDEAVTRFRDLFSARPASPGAPSALERAEGV